MERFLCADIVQCKVGKITTVVIAAVCCNICNRGSSQGPKADDHGLWGIVYFIILAYIGYMCILGILGIIHV